MSTPGICYLVGAGPGDPGLITLRGKECVEMADVLVYDALSSPEILRWARKDCERINVGKRAKDHTLSQEGINALIVEKTRQGKKVVRLKGGDPMIFVTSPISAVLLAIATAALVAVSLPAISRKRQTIFVEED